MLQTKYLIRSDILDLLKLRANNLVNDSSLGREVHRLHPRPSPARLNVLDDRGRDLPGRERDHQDVHVEHEVSPAGNGYWSQEATPGNIWSREVVTDNSWEGADSCGEAHAHLEPRNPDFPTPLPVLGREPYRAPCQLSRSTGTGLLGDSKFTGSFNKN